jgi:hypothetical protein
MIESLKAECEVMRGRSGARLRDTLRRGVCVRGGKENLVQSINLNFGYLPSTHFGE